MKIRAALFPAAKVARKRSVAIPKIRLTCSGESSDPLTRTTESGMPTDSADSPWDNQSQRPIEFPVSQ